MDFDSSSKFIASLARFLQSLCNGYVEFDKGVEVIGHIYLSVDSDSGRKIDYVLNEKVCKNDNSVTFISNSFHAQPAEKPKPIPKKPDSEKKNDESVVLDESGQTVPNSTNVGTIGFSQDGSLSSNKRPRSPFQGRMGVGRGSGGPPVKSPRYQDSGGHLSKSAHADIPSTNNLLNTGEDYDGAYGGDEDGSQNYPSNFLSQDYSNSEVDQKPVIEPDISIVKEEYMSSQQSGASYSGSSQPTGPGRGRAPSTSQSSYPMMHQNSSPYSSGNYSGSSIEPRDPSELTRAQQEELEMYYRKGTDQHLTFLRNMREAHAMYPFTGKRDKELFDKALAESAGIEHPGIEIKLSPRIFFFNMTLKEQAYILPKSPLPNFLEDDVYLKLKLISRIPILRFSVRRTENAMYITTMRQVQRVRNKYLFAFSSNAHPPLSKKKGFRDILCKFYKENAKKTIEINYCSCSCECLFCVLMPTVLLRISISTA